MTKGYQSKIAHPQGGAYLIIGEDASGLPCILAAGQSDTDVEIVAELGADTLYADGSIYVSCVDGAGKLFLKTNDVWTDEKV